MTSIFVLFTGKFSQDARRETLQKNNNRSNFRVKKIKKFSNSLHGWMKWRKKIEGQENFVFFRSSSSSWSMMVIIKIMTTTTTTDGHYGFTVAVFADDDPRTNFISFFSRNKMKNPKIVTLRQDVRSVCVFWMMRKFKI